MGVLLAIRGFIAFIPPFIWKWLAIAAIGFGLYSFGDIRGRRIEREICVTAAAEAQKGADDQDAQAAKDNSAQDLEITNNLLAQKKVDDAELAKLRSQLAGAKGPACVYDKSNADGVPASPAPSGGSVGKRLRDYVPSRKGTSNKKPAGPAKLPAAVSRPKS